jgi:hypothetical protein
VTVRLFMLAAIAGLALAAPAAAADDARLARVAEQVRRAEGVREIKRLQHAYAHYVQMGMWDAAAELFARNGELARGETGARGRAAIAAQLRRTVGDGRAGLGPGRLHVEMVMAPVVTLAADGLSGKGRWHELSIDAQHKVRADWAGGIQEDAYIVEDGRWKIARLGYHPQFAGPYATGWRNVSADPRLIPYHYSVDDVGAPSIRLPADARPRLPAGTTLAKLEQRVARLNDEAQIRNLQDAYGYYVDRRMWDDVADLFAAEGTLAGMGQGAAAGRAAIRRQLEALAPAGLKSGELNDRLQIDPVITIDAGGVTASARGLELGMIGSNGAEAYWTLAVFENRYVKQGGVWTIQAMRIFPRARTDYFRGWAESAEADAPGVYPVQGFPAISFRHPVTGKAAAYPASLRIIPLAAAPGMASPQAPAQTAGDESVRLDELERQLAVASAHDGAENVSTAYGYYIDEFRWHELADLFSAQGWKELSYVGTYVGRDRLLQSLILRYGDKGRTSPSLAIHQKIQPVITPGADGRSARIHLRLFQIGSGPTGPGAFIGGTYENQAVIENGIWKISGMDLDYTWLSGYKEGWARITPGAAGRFAPPLGALSSLPPDRPLRGPAFAPFPDHAPIPFHYRNPVSGRVPPLLLDQ